MLDYICAQVLLFGHRIWRAFLGISAFVIVGGLTFYVFHQSPEGPGMTLWPAAGVAAGVGLVSS